MRVKIQKGVANGTVFAPPSKSMAHRLLICASLARGKSVITNLGSNADILATLDSLKKLGAKINLVGDTAEIEGFEPENIQSSPLLDCNESGSTLRFLLPLGMLCGKEVHFTGSEKLLQRPLTVFEEICKEKGVKFTLTPEKVTVCGQLKSGEYTVLGNISSQFISGLLFLLPLLQGDSVINIVGGVESRSYIDLTISALKQFGVSVAWQGDSLQILGNQSYKPQNLSVEGDYSGTAFFAGLNALGSQIEIKGLNESSLQGDKVYEKHFVALQNGTPEIDLTDCPDLAPILFAVASQLNGATFVGTKRLKIKESDRAEAMRQELEKFGAKVIVNENSVIIEKSQLHSPTEPIFGHNDHRIVMSMAVLCTLYGGEILGAEAVSKSFPDFFEKLANLGIEVEKLDS